MTETPDSELTDFLNNPEKIIPLREPIGHRTWTDGISVPYGSCDDCLAIGNERKAEEGRILLYDLVQLAQIVRENTPIEKGFPELAAAAPFVEITGCDHHLKRAAEQCFLGTFAYHETGKDALHTFARPQTLLWIETPLGEIHVMASYPIHPDLAVQAKFLEENFQGIVGDYRAKEEAKE